MTASTYLPIRAVVLDMGNVLIFHDNAKVYREMAKLLKRTPSEIQALLSTGELSDRINRGVLDAEGTYEEVSRALDVRVPRAQFEAVWSCHFEVHHAVLPYVESLRGRVRLVLLSNTNALHVEHCRRALPILQSFDALLFSNEVHALKPEPAFFERAILEAGAPAAECAYFDDLPAYVEAARRAGMQGFVFTTAEAFATQLSSIGL